MYDGTNITWLARPAGAAEPGSHTASLDAQAGPVRLAGQLASTRSRAALSDLVPPAQQLADEVVRQTTRDLHGQSLSITCCAGCSACCEYLIPVSPPEALALWQKILHMPAPSREQIITAFLKMVAHINQSPPPDLAAMPESEALEALSDWYASLDATCPLLQQDLCAIYTSRPLACRECVSTFPASFCVDPQPDRGERVRLPISVAEALYETAGLMLARPPESIILATLPQWIDLASEAYQRTWPAQDLIDCFSATIHRQARQTRRHLAERTDQLLAAAGV